MEQWDIYDKYGNPTGRTMEKGSMASEEDYHLAMEAWIINSKKEILIQQRSKYCEILPNIWGHTTGRMMAGENSAAGCIREIKEELGISVREEEVHFIRRIIREDSYRLIWDVYIVKKDFLLSGIKLQEQEVAQAKWVPVEELKNMMNSSEFSEYPEIYEVLSYVEEVMGDVA
jgi:isopentenyldiphosphate isomerase